MKLIRVFVFFVVISLLVGIGSAFNGQSTKSVDSAEKEFVEKETDGDISQAENEEKKKDEKESTENVDKNSKKEESTTNSSSIVSKEESESTKKVEKNKIEEQQSVDKKDVPNNNKVETKTEEKPENNTNVQKQESSIIANPPVQEEKKELEIWEKIGISEDDYYNKPMYNYQTVTHDTEERCNSDGNIATEVKIDPITNMGYQEYTSFWCYEVISYSGRTLGFMLELS